LNLGENKEITLTFDFNSEDMGKEIVCVLTVSPKESLVNGFTICTSSLASGLY
jgi:hypothetical protein